MDKYICIKIFKPSSEMKNLLFYVEEMKNLLTQHRIYYVEFIGNDKFMAFNYRIYTLDMVKKFTIPEDFLNEFLLPLSEHRDNKIDEILGE